MTGDLHFNEGEENGVTAKEAAPICMSYKRVMLSPLGDLDDISVLLCHGHGVLLSAVGDL